jgi:hypothetical protein
MKLRILRSALNDLGNGRKFYDWQGAGLGGYFFDSVFADIDSLSRHGGIHLKIFGYHRKLASRFPYAIYYRMNGRDEVIVFRVLDCRQDPAKTRSALEQS